MTKRVDRDSETTTPTRRWALLGSAMMAASLLAACGGAPEADELVDDADYGSHSQALSASDCLHEGVQGTLYGASAGGFCCMTGDIVNNSCTGTTCALDANQAQGLSLCGVQDGPNQPQCLIDGVQGNLYGASVGGFCSFPTGEICALDPAQSQGNPACDCFVNGQLGSLYGESVGGFCNVGGDVCALDPNQTQGNGMCHCPDGATAYGANNAYCCMGNVTGGGSSCDADPCALDPADAAAAGIAECAEMHKGEDYCQSIGYDEYYGMFAGGFCRVGSDICAVDGNQAQGNAVCSTTGSSAADDFLASAGTAWVDGVIQSPAMQDAAKLLGFKSISVGLGAGANTHYGVAADASLAWSIEGGGDPNLYFYAGTSVSMNLNPSPSADVNVPVGFWYNTPDQLAGPSLAFEIAAGAAKLGKVGVKASVLFDPTCGGASACPFPGQLLGFIFAPSVGAEAADGLTVNVSMALGESWQLNGVFQNVARDAGETFQVGLQWVNGQESVVSQIGDDAAVVVGQIGAAVTCAWETVTDGATCGYSTVTSAAICGYSTVTSAATCGTSYAANALGCAGAVTACWAATWCGGSNSAADVACRAASNNASCDSVETYCYTANTCSVAGTCSVANTCSVEVCD
jgi:hypothetical protein